MTAEGSDKTRVAMLLSSNRASAAQPGAVRLPRAQRCRVSAPQASSSSFQPSADAAFPWRGQRVLTTAGQGPPPMVPRFARGGPGEASDPMALLLQQRIVFLGTQARCVPAASRLAALCAAAASRSPAWNSGSDSVPAPSGQPRAHLPTRVLACWQVDDFSADAVVSQLLYLDSLDPTKARRAP